MGGEDYAFKKITILLMFTILYLSTHIIVNVYAEEHTLSCCGTDPQLIQELHNELLQKKSKELNQQDNPWSNEISLFSSSIGSVRPSRHLMPSTGTVNALVIPITFPDHPISKERLELLKDELFGLHSDLNCFKYEATARPSVKEFFRDNSNGKLNFTGELMPIYTTSELPVYYEENDYYLYDLIEEILNYYKNSGIVDDYSQYD